MKNHFTRILFVFSILVSMAMVFPPAVYAQSGTGDDQLILGQSFTLERGKVQEGSIIVFGGTLTVEDGARVNGDIFVAGGSLDLKGTVKGAVSSLGSYVNVGDTALIEGDLSIIGGNIIRSEKALIKGKVDISSGEKINFTRPTDVMKNIQKTPVLIDLVGPIKDVFGATTRVLGLSALAALIALFLIRPVEYVTEAVVRKPMLSFLIGLLSAVVVPALMVLLIITLILSPFGLLGFLLLGAAMLFGWIAMGYEVGKRITGSLKVDWAPPIIAGVGVLVLSVLSEMTNFIPCFGWIIPTFISLLGLGAVIMSRFGTQLVDVTPTIHQSPAPQIPTQPPTQPSSEQDPVPPSPSLPQTPLPPGTKKVAKKKSNDEKPESPVV